VTTPATVADAGQHDDSARPSTLRAFWLAHRDSRLWLWSAFAFVHLLWAVTALSFDGYRLGDVLTQYLPWAQRVIDHHVIVGVDRPWVYPIVALVPILLPILFGPTLYGWMWVLMVTALDAAAVAVLTRRRIRPRWSAAWWWIGFMLLLGPISITRIDTVSVPVVIIALVWLATRPRVALVLLTLATWIKVWPAAILAAMLIGMRRRWRTAIVAAATSVVIAAVPLLLGGSVKHLLSFVMMQGDRGLQVEAPVTTPWLWVAAFHGNLGATRVYYDRALNTFEVTGPGTHAAAELMTPLLAIAVVVIAVLGILAARRNGAEALPALMLALVMAFILFNKVLSPQYITWIAAPVIYGLIVQARRFRTPAIMAAVTALLTQAFYPWLYSLILAPNVFGITLLLARNVMLCVLLIWAVAQLCRPAPALARP
jgi:hypothetical protein